MQPRDDAHASPDATDPRHADDGCAPAPSLSLWDEVDGEEAMVELAAVLDHAPVAMLLVDCDRRVRKLNRAAAAAADRPGEEMLGLRGGEALRCLRALDAPEGCGFGPHCETCAVRRTVLDTFATGQPHHQVEAQYALQRRGRTEEATLLVSTAPVRFRKTEHVLVCLENITEHRKLQDHLRHSDKMRAIGELAGGVAHDFNNQLTGIQAFAEILREELPEGAPHRAIADKILIAAHNASDHVSNLLTFSRRARKRESAVDLHSVVENVIRLLQSSIDKRIRIQRDLGASRAVVWGAMAEVDNAILNVAVNARDAMPDGGCLTFATREVTVTHEACDREQMDIQPGDYVELSISDTGVGMDATTRERVFEPFFTTKAAGKGTGLGLAALYGCVKGHHGTVRVESTPGQGTTVRIRLPFGRETRRPGVSEPKPQPPSGTGHVLLVDDEPLVRESAAQILRSLGYTVTECAGAPEAITRFKADPTGVDLVLLDIMMPEMSGVETCRAIRARDPQARILLFSGHIRNERVERFVRESGLPLLQKPFTIKELGTAVSACLQGEDPSHGG